VKKLVFYGDGLLWPPEGYGEQLVDLLVFERPAETFQSFHPGEESLSLEKALKGAPLHLIGKAPDFIYLSIGAADLLQGHSPDSSLAELDHLLRLLQQKTRAQIFFPSLCTPFFPEEIRAQALAFNAGLPDLVRKAGANFLDLDFPACAFLDRHRQGKGEKRALHQGPLRLTSMGRVFFSQTAFRLLPWQRIFPQ
jgi:hypothetical protein